MSKPHRDIEAAALDLARGLYNYADGFRVTNGLAAGPSWSQATNAQRAPWVRLAVDALEKSKAASDRKTAIAEVVETFRDTMSKIQSQGVVDPVVSVMKSRLHAWEGDRDEGDVMVGEMRALADSFVCGQLTDVRYAMMSAMADIAKIWRVYS